MRKKFKSKKKFNLKKILIPFILIFIVTFLYLMNKKVRLSMSNETIIEYIFKTTNNYSYEGKKNNNITHKLYNYIKENTFNNPVNLLKNELKYEKAQTISFVYGENKEPLVYIYNSHQNESYSREYLEEHNIIPDVLMASLMLKDKLKSIGINSIVEESDIPAYMKEQGLSHAGSYKASRYFLTSALNNYPNAKLYIDLHRDAASHSVSTTTIENKPCAKVLFVIGLENPNYQENLNIVTKLNNIILEKYPSLTRGIMKKEGYGVNGIYNQDLNSNIILLEVGGNENNIEEVNNTLDLIAIVIGEYINEKR